MHLNPFRVDREVCPAQPPIWSSGLQHLPFWASCISPCVAQPAPRPQALLLPLPAPVPGQTTFPCTCNPITNCRVSLEVIPPEGTSSLPASLLLREELATLCWSVLLHKAAWRWHSIFGGQHETEEVNLVRVTQPFRPEYKYSYLTSLAQCQPSFCISFPSFLLPSFLLFFPKHQVEN